MCISNAFLGDCIIYKVCLPYIRALHFRLLFINQRLDLTLQTSLLQQYATETQFRYRKLKPSFDIGNRKPGFCTGNQNLFFYVSHLFRYWDLKTRSNFGTYCYLSQHIFCYFFFQMFLRFPTSWVTAILGFSILLKPKSWFRSLTVLQPK